MFVWKTKLFGFIATTIVIFAASLLFAPFEIVLGQTSIPTKETKSTEQAGAANSANPTPATPAPKPPPALTLPAMLVADEAVDIYAKASGFVSSVAVDIGSKVKKGDVLAELDIPEMSDELRHAEAMLAAKAARVEALKSKVEQARLAVDSARADLQRATAERELSRVTYQRKTELHAGNAIPDQDYDEAQNRLAITDAQVLVVQAKVAGAEGDTQAAQAEVAAGEAEVKVAEADRARLRTLIGYTTIRAPFDGVITNRSVDPGAFVRSAAQTSGSALFGLKKVDRLRLVVDVPEDKAPFVQAGVELEVRIQADDESPLPTGETSPQHSRALVLTVSRTANVIRADTRTMRVECDMDNQKGQFLPGMYAKVTIQLVKPTAVQPGA